MSTRIVRERIVTHFGAEGPTEPPDLDTKRALAHKLEILLIEQHLASSSIHKVVKRESIHDIANFSRVV